MIKMCYIIFILSLTSCIGLKNICDVDPKKWQLDECGSNGYKSNTGDCIFENSQKKPIFKWEKDVLGILGKPDTFFIDNNKKHYYYVTFGGVYNGKCYNGGMLKTLQFFIDEKGKVTSVSGGIH